MDQERVRLPCWGKGSIASRKGAEMRDTEVSVLEGQWTGWLRKEGKQKRAHRCKSWEEESVEFEGKDGDMPSHCRLVVTAAGLTAVFQIIGCKGVLGPMSENLTLRMAPK